MIVSAAAMLLVFADTVPAEYEYARDNAREEIIREYLKRPFDVRREPDAQRVRDANRLPIVIDRPHIKAAPLLPDIELFLAEPARLGDVMQMIALSTGFDAVFYDGRLTDRMVNETPDGLFDTWGFLSWVSREAGVLLVPFDESRMIFVLDDPNAANDSGSDDDR